MNPLPLGAARVRLLLVLDEAGGYYRRRFRAREPAAAGRESGSGYPLVMGLVGDPERDAAAVALRSAYARGYLTHQELSERLDQALSARSTRELSASVRRLPGGGWFLLSSWLRPFLAPPAQNLRQRASEFLRRLALGLFAATSVVLLLGFALWTLAEGFSSRAAMSFVLAWLLFNAPAWLIWRGARRLSR